MPEGLSGIELREAMPIRFTSAAFPQASKQVKFGLSRAMEDLATIFFDSFRLNCTDTLTALAGPAPELHCQEFNS